MKRSIIVEEHGGWIEVAKREREGAVFSLFSAPINTRSRLLLRRINSSETFRKTFDAPIRNCEKREGAPTADKRNSLRGKKWTRHPVSNLLGIYGRLHLTSRAIIPFDISEMARLGGTGQ
jgi:hypothetical protein